MAHSCTACKLAGKVCSPGPDAHPSCLEGERKQDYNMDHRVIPCPVPAGAPVSQSR